MRGGAWFGGEREGWMMALSAVYTASLVGAVWMALDRPSVQTKAADAHRESLRDRKPGGREREEEVLERQERLRGVKPATSHGSS